MNKTLDISLDGIPQGVLTVLPDKTWQLVLHANAQRLSLSFPRQQTISGAVVQRWFENLLPEGSERLVAERRLQVRRGDSLTLLQRMGWDLAGAIQVGSTSGVLVKPEQPLVDVLSIALQSHQSDPYGQANPPSLADAAERFSLAGAQTKVGVVFKSGQWVVPPSDEPSTHLFKPEFSRWRGIAVAEAFGQQLAQKIGLPAAAAQLIFVGQTPGVLVERFDRITETNGTVRRIHQEDLCQALGLAAEDKFDVAEAPSRVSAFAQLARRQKMSGLIEDLEDGLIFQYLLGNADAHLKNFSIVLNSNAVSLAPLYDSVPTTWFATDRTPALLLGSANDPTTATMADWEDLADELGVSKKSLLKKKGNMAKRMGAAVPKVVQHLESVLATSGVRDDVIQAQQQTLRDGTVALLQRLPSSRRPKGFSPLSN